MKRARHPQELRKVIDESPFTHRELARAAKCSHNLPSRLVAGRTTNDGDATRIARLLGYTTVEDLFEDALSNNEQQANTREAVA